MPTAGVTVELGAAKSVEWISRTEHVNASYLAKLLSLAYLAPDLTDEILRGTQPRQLMLKHIRQLDIPLDWQAQDACLRNFAADDFGISLPRRTKLAQYF